MKDQPRPVKQQKTAVRDESFMRTTVSSAYDPKRGTPEEARYVRCNATIGMQSCNLPLSHAGTHEHPHCCLICGCGPCICNKVSTSEKAKRQP